MHSENAVADLHSMCLRSRFPQPGALYVRLRGCASQRAGTALRGGETATFVWLVDYILSPLAAFVAGKSEAGDRSYSRNGTAVARWPAASATARTSRQRIVEV